MKTNNNLEDSLTELFSSSGYKMVDVSSKETTNRKALAMGEIILGSEVIEMIKADFRNGNFINDVTSNEMGMELEKLLPI